MSTPVSTCTAFQREFLTIRARLLDLAAALDRVERTDGTLGDDARRAAIRRSLEILAAGGADRAERIQLLFSLPYEENWRTTPDS